MADLQRQRSSLSDRGALWLVAALLTALPLVFALTREYWESRFPINETVALFQTGGIFSDTGEADHSLRDPVLVSFLDPNTRSWYRPLFFATFYGSWHLTHTIEGTLLLFRIVQLTTAALLIVGFLLLLRPRTFPEYAAAVVATAIFVGMPGFRSNLEMPMLMTLVGMLFAVAFCWLLERPHQWWHGPALVLLVALAVGYKEQGLVLVPLLVGAWLAGAPGVRRIAVGVVLALTIAYLGMRFSTTGQWKPFEQDVAIGFTTIPAAEVSERYGDFPYLVYAYNAAATAGNILFSEPTDGAFNVVSSATRGTLSAQEILRVLTSTVTTVLLVWWAVRTVRRDIAAGWSLESRLTVALVLALGASAALGFNYARDRLGGMAVVFYALAAYYALRAAAARVVQLRPAVMWGASVALLLLSAGWQLRMVDSLATVHGWDLLAHREWLADRAQEHLDRADQKQFLEIFDAMAGQGLRPIRGHNYSLTDRIDAALEEE